MPHDVFISYSSKDKTSAEEVCAMLESECIRCWIAMHNVKAGELWGDAIMEAIKESRVMVLILSESANDSAPIRCEVERAFGLGIPIIALRIENVLPAKSLELIIRSSQWLDAFNPPVEKHFRFLAQVIQKILLGPIEKKENVSKKLPVSNSMVAEVLNEALKAEREISFHCVHCGQNFKVDKTAAGTTIRCVSCNQPTKIPIPSDAWPQKESSNQILHGWKFFSLLAAILLVLAIFWHETKNLPNRNMPSQALEENHILSQPQLASPTNELTANAIDKTLNLTSTPPDKRIPSNSWMFTTIAGQAGSSGTQNGIGSDARFNMYDHRARLALDSLGNLYLTDCGNNEIRKIEPSGLVSTLAGQRSSGSSDGLGAEARFNSPHGIAADQDGNLYVADSGNNTIRKITPAGLVTTIAGQARVSGSTDGPSNVALFNCPLGIAISPHGNLFVTDWGNNTIRRITRDGVVSTVAGRAGSSGWADGPGYSARFHNLGDIAVGPQGNIYISDISNNTIREIDSYGTVRTLVGQVGNEGSNDGVGVYAQFKSPGGITVDQNGILYVTDTANSTIRKITLDGITTTIGGLAQRFGSKDGVGSQACFNIPVGIAVDKQENIYVSDDHNDTIRKGQLLK